jgi:hypothetical protein
MRDHASQEGPHARDDYRVVSIVTARQAPAGLRHQSARTIAEVACRLPDGVVGARAEVHDLVADQVSPARASRRVEKVGQPGTERRRAQKGDGTRARSGGSSFDLRHGVPPSAVTHVRPDRPAVVPVFVSRRLVSVRSRPEVTATSRSSAFSPVRPARKPWRIFNWL